MTEEIMPVVVPASPSRPAGTVWITNLMPDRRTDIMQWTAPGTDAYEQSETVELSPAQARHLYERLGSFLGVTTATNTVTETTETETDALATLRNEIRPGWTVDIIDHDYINDSRNGASVVQADDYGLTLRPHRPWSSQGRSFPTMRLSWDRDLTADGRTVRLYRTGGRVLVKTFRFRPPAS